jgi:uncharacterized protein DUF6588
MRKIYLLIPILLLLAVTPRQVTAQFELDAKTILEGYSLELFETNAEGFMSPLVIVSNVGANDGFFNSAFVPKKDSLHFKFSVKSMSAWVRDDQKTYTAQLPLADQPGDVFDVQIFKQLLRVAADSGEVEEFVETSTVFGDQGSGFTIPKDFLIGLNLPGLDSAALAGIPDQLPLTSGTRQTFVFAAVPQLEIGTYKHTQFLVRYIPPFEFDTAVGEFSFAGVAFKHGISNWLDDPTFDAAVQVSYQHSTIKNKVGDTQAILDAKTDMFMINVHASKRFGFFEPYIGVSYERLESKGSYTFVLPKRLSDQLGYDIDPQTARVELKDDAVKLTIGATMYYGPAEFNIGAGISKHFILGAGLGVRFDPPFMYDK